MSQSKLLNYNSERGARAYRADYENKLHRKLSDKWERTILSGFFQRIGRVNRLLDVPCGAGRLQGLFRSVADQVYEADWSQTMLAINRGEHPKNREPYIRCSALDLPFGDRAMDVVVSIRLSHHLDETKDREGHLRELMRVADKAVIMTWFSASSLKNILREVRVKLMGKRPKNVLRTGRVRQIALESGFHLESATPLARIGSGHLFGLLRRR